MRIHRGSAIGVVIVASSAMVATALAVTPKKATKFKGTASGKVTFASGPFTAKDALSFKTSSSGKAIDGFTFKDTVCDFSKSGMAEAPTIKVSGGKFSIKNAKTKSGPDSTEDGHKAYWDVTLSGKFTSATKASGKLNYTAKETGNSSSCGPIKMSFTATG
jgi:hypothetical protein